MKASPINHMVLGKVECKEDRQCLGFGNEGDPSPTLAPTHMHAAAIGIDAYNQSCEEEVGHTLRNPSGGDNTAKVAMSYDGYNQSGAEEICHTLRAASGGESNDLTAKVAIKNPTQYIVRRLSPKECERLMGYPDDYTIPRFAEITDELVEEFVRIHNDFNTLMNPNKPFKQKTAKQVRKWLETISNPMTCPDAPRYKVCGNGWAINCARWVLQGVDKYLHNLDS